MQPMGTTLPFFPIPEALSICVQVAREGLGEDSLPLATIHLQGTVPTLRALRRSVPTAWCARSDPVNRGGGRSLLAAWLNVARFPDELLATLSIEHDGAVALNQVLSHLQPGLLRLLCDDDTLVLAQDDDVP